MRSFVLNYAAGAVFAMAVLGATVLGSVGAGAQTAAESPVACTALTVAHRKLHGIDRQPGDPGR
jgi:hypothetical protein